MPTQKILLVDDHMMFSQGLVSLLKNHFDVTVVNSAAAMRSCLNTEKFALVLLDIYLGDGKNGLALAPELRAAGQAFFILSGTATQADQRAFVRMGARGFLSKENNFDDLLPAIQGVVSGFSAFPKGLLEKIFARSEDDIPCLTPREISVLDQLFLDASKSNQAIAEALGISETRVKFCLTEMFHKFGVTNRHSLLAEARRRGYYPQDKAGMH